VRQGRGITDTNHLGNIPKSIKQDILDFDKHFRQ